MPCYAQSSPLHRLLAALLGVRRLPQSKAFRSMQALYHFSHSLVFADQNSLFYVFLCSHSPPAIQPSPRIPAPRRQIAPLCVFFFEFQPHGRFFALHFRSEGAGSVGHLASARVFAWRAVVDSFWSDRFVLQSVDRSEYGMSEAFKARFAAFRAPICRVWRHDAVVCLPDLGSFRQIREQAFYRLLYGSFF